MAGMQRSFGFALVAFGLAACDAASTTSPKLTAGQQVTVTVDPGSAQVAPGATRQFTATVTGSVNTAVQWTVQEGGTGGAITPAGAYTAPAAAGTYHVVATSAADPGASASASVTVTATPAVGVTVAPATATVAAGSQTTFRATVTNAANTAVTWSVREATGCGSISRDSGAYTAPAAAATCHVVATSVQDGTRSATATVTVTGPPPPITVTVSPATASMDACSTRTFTAAVGGSTNQAVTWTVQEGTAGGIATPGTSGVSYTAPATAGTYHLVATSSANGTSTASATVTVVERVLGVAVSPAVINVAPGATAQFTATVTTTCGAFASLQTIDSAGQIVAQ